jgi:hypothetical protein
MMHRNTIIVFVLQIRSVIHLATSAGAEQPAGTLPKDNHVTKVRSVQQLPHSGFDAAGGAGLVISGRSTEQNQTWPYAK